MNVMAPAWFKRIDLLTSSRGRSTSYFQDFPYSTAGLQGASHYQRTYTRYIGKQVLSR